MGITGSLLACRFEHSKRIRLNLSNICWNHVRSLDVLFFFVLWLFVVWLPRLFVRDIDLEQRCSEADDKL